jgi:hypothetical protein
MPRRRGSIDQTKDVENRKMKGRSSSLVSKESKDFKKIKKKVGKKIFAVDLRRLEKPVPDIIERLIKYIEDEGLETIGLFRVPGNLQITTRSFKVHGDNERDD